MNFLSRKKKLTLFLMVLRCERWSLKKRKSSVYQKNLENVTAFFKKVGDYCEIENPYTEPKSKTKIRIFSPSK